MTRIAMFLLLTASILLIGAGPADFEITGTGPIVDISIRHDGTVLTVKNNSANLDVMCVADITTLFRICTELEVGDVVGVTARFPTEKDRFPGLIMTSILIE